MSEREQTDDIELAVELEAASEATLVDVQPVASKAAATDVQPSPTPVDVQLPPAPPSAEPSPPDAPMGDVPMTFGACCNRLADPAAMYSFGRRDETRTRARRAR